jgi:hypothetical protein
MSINYFRGVSHDNVCSKFLGKVIRVLLLILLLFDINRSKDEVLPVKEIVDHSSKLHQNLETPPLTYLPSLPLTRIHGTMDPSLTFHPKKISLQMRVCADLYGDPMALGNSKQLHNQMSYIGPANRLKLFRKACSTNLYNMVRNNSKSATQAVLENHSKSGFIPYGPYCNASKSMNRKINF